MNFFAISYKCIGNMSGLKNAITRVQSVNNKLVLEQVKNQLFGG